MMNDKNNDENLANNISNTIENASTKIIDVYKEKNIGYIKLLGTVGSSMPIILAITDSNVGLFALFLSFIMILMAMKRMDFLNTKTKSFKYMLISALAYVIGTLITITLYGRLYFSFEYNISATIIVGIFYLISVYFYYKSYIQVSIATGLNIFKLAVIAVIISFFIIFVSETLSSILIFMSAIFIIIGWVSIKSVKNDS